MDNYKPGREIPYFLFRVKLKEVENPRPLRAEVDFDGLEKEQFITVTRDPETTAPGV